MGNRLEGGTLDPSGTHTPEQSVAHRSTAQRVDGHTVATLQSRQYSIFNKNLWPSLPSRPVKAPKVARRKALPTKVVIAQQPIQIVPRTRPQRVPVVNYAPQLEMAPTPKQRYVPQTTPPLAPRRTLDDLTSEPDSLFVAPSRLGHGLEGVYSVKDLPMDRSHPHVICEFRS